LEFEAKWKRFEDCTSEPAESFERDREKLLEEFINNNLEQERVQSEKNRRFAIVMDEEVDKEQYIILEDID
jgi:hypothetical protein